MGSTLHPCIIFTFKLNFITYINQCTTIACKPEINEHSMNSCSFDVDTINIICCFFWLKLMMFVTIHLEEVFCEIGSIVCPIPGTQNTRITSGVNCPDMVL
jgi:hypothetical protein